jgi:hypothetical protein
MMATVVLLLPGTVPSRAEAQERTVADVLAELAADPTIEEVQEAALRQSALEPEKTRSLLRRVRWAGVLPRVEASLSRGYGRDEDLDREYEEMDDLSLATDQDLELRVAVQWDLDRLIFDPEELRAHRETAYLTQRRRELLLSVTGVYYELVRLRAEALRGGPATAEDTLARALRTAELEALLDGLTGGLVSRYRRDRAGEGRSP